jgi:hypothetical protein
MLEPPGGMSIYSVSRILVQWGLEMEDGKTIIAITLSVEAHVVS